MDHTFKTIVIVDDNTAILTALRICLATEYERIVTLSSPDTLVATLAKENDVDMVLLMSVNPGFGGQKFIENTINKVHRLVKLIDQSQSKAIIEVDGGVNNETAPRLVKAGVNALVSGNYVFKSLNPEEVIKQLKNL